MLPNNDPVLERRDGVEVWVFPSGRSFPVIAGASEGDGGSGSGDGGGEGGSGSGSGGGSGSGSGDGGGQGGGNAGDRGDPDLLGDAGKRALQAERDARAAAEKALAEREKKLKEFEDRDKTELQKAIDDGKAAADNASKLESRVAELSLQLAVERQAVVAGIIDPEDARLLNEGLIERDRNGEPKPESVKAALEDLRARKPHLFRSTRQAPGGGDGGPRGGDAGGSDGSVNDWLRARAGHEPL